MKKQKSEWYDIRTGKDVQVKIKISERGKGALLALMKYKGDNKNG